METSIELRIIRCVRELVKLARENNGVVNANVDLSEQNISSLPEEIIEIRGWLYCIFCPRLVSLGNLQSVGNQLNCSNCPRLTSLGNLQSVGYHLDCSNCSKLSSLGNLQTVGCSLICYNCPRLTSLGNLQSVGSWLDCSDCPKLASLGNLNWVGGSIECYDCPNLSSLGNLQSVGDDLNCSDCPELVTLGNLQTIDGCLWCYNCPLADDEQSLLKVVKRAIWLKCDARGRRHCQDGHAFISKDRRPEYFWHDVRVPAFVILRPDSITLSQINNERNAEVRRVMIFRYGLERYLKDVGGEQIDHDPRFGTLWRILIDNRPVFMLEVINSTPEDDGSFKHYFLSVAPTCNSNPALPEGSPMDSSYKAAWSLHRIIWGLGIPYNPKVET